MKDDVRGSIYGAIILFLLVVFVWVVGFVYVSACGFTLSCNRGKQLAETTPVPTLIPAALPVMHSEGQASASEKCSVAAADLIGAWVESGASESEPFQFTDSAQRTCEASFADVQPLFTQSNLWYTGSRSCVNCHSGDVTLANAQLDLSSYEGIMAGSRRADAAAKGTDILGGGSWNASLLYQFLSEAKDGVAGHESDLTGLVVYSGTPLPDATATPKP